METPDAPPPQQIDMAALMNQIHAPFVRTALQSMIHYMGPQSIAAVCGILGAVFQPYREALRNFDPEGMPGPVIEFYNGLAAIVDHAWKMHEAGKPQIIVPDGNP